MLIYCPVCPLSSVNCDCWCANSRVDPSQIHPNPQICGPTNWCSCVLNHISLVCSWGQPAASQVNAILAGCVLFWLPFLRLAGQLASDLHCSPVEINWIEWPQLGLKYALQWTHLDPSGWLINRPTRSSNKHSWIYRRAVDGLSQENEDIRVF